MAEGAAATFRFDTTPAGTVTFLLSDIEGSTRNWEADPEAMRAALERHDALLNELIAQHGGHVLTERGEGDSFFAVFAWASEAVAAASAVQRALAVERWPEPTPIRVRVAVHTGEADADFRGPEVNRCARIRAIAHGGQVLLSAPTATLVRAHLPAGASLVDLGLHRLRDLTVPERLFQLDHPDLPSAFPPLKSLDAYRHNLPIQLTNFIGRAGDLDEVKALTRHHRLVTLTGSGGAGKTRLAFQAAAEMVDEYAEGVWFVDLAPLAEPALVARAVAAAVGVAETPDRPLVATLAERLADSALLIVLDNCEHLVAASASVAEALLQAVPGLRMIATSREPLNIAGETAWRVPSLSLPEPGTSESPGALARYEAVQLFRDRAIAHEQGFALTEQNASAIAQICRRVDGVPLALELAAARVRVLSPDEILERLEDRFRLLTAGSRTALPRQQTLRAAVDWSHELLSEPERALFRWLSVFAGSFDLEAAERVGRGASVTSEDVLDLLAGLVDKSLVVTDAERRSRRYRLLDTLRQYGREKLIAAGEEEDSADAHLDHFLGLAEAGYAGRVDESTIWLERLERDHDNLRAALDWSLVHRPDPYLFLAGALGWFWHLHSQHLLEGRERLTLALASARASTSGTEEARSDAGRRARALARAWWGAAMIAAWLGDGAAAVPAAEEALGRWRAIGDPVEIVLALEAGAWTSFFAGEDRAGLAHAQEGLALSRRLGNRRLTNRLAIATCQLLVALGDVAAAEPMAREALAAGRELREPRDIHYALHFLGDCALYRADHAPAAQLYRQSLAAALEYGNVAEAAVEMQGLAMSAAGLGHSARALRLLGAADAKMEGIGMDISGMKFWQLFLSRYRPIARAGAGDSADALREEGRAMDFDAAIAYALDPAAD